MLYALLTNTGFRGIFVFLEEQRPLIIHVRVYDHRHGERANDQDYEKNITFGCKKKKNENYFPSDNKGVETFNFLLVVQFPWLVLDNNIPLRNRHNNICALFVGTRNKYHVTVLTSDRTSDLFDPIRTFGIGMADVTYTYTYSNHRPHLYILLENHD